MTLDAICRVSQARPRRPRGEKVSNLENPEAHAYYREHSTSYQAMRKGQGARKENLPLSCITLHIDPNRDVDRVRYRYLQMTKPEIVKHLLMVEQAYAEVHQQLAQLQFQLIERSISEMKNSGKHAHHIATGRSPAGLRKMTKVLVMFPVTALLW